MASHSIYHLIVALIHDGRLDWGSKVEQLDPAEIVAELERRTGQRLGQSAERWSAWFSDQDEFGYSTERNFVRTILKIQAIERRALARIAKKTDR